VSLLLHHFDPILRTTAKRRSAERSAAIQEFYTPSAMHSTAKHSAAADIRLLLLVLAAALLVPWPNCLFSHHQAQTGFANAQGNSIDPKDFTAAPAVDLDSLELFLDVSDSYTGGKRKPKNKNAAISDVLSLQQLQLQKYYVNSAPGEYGSFMVKLNPGGKSFMPKVRDQKNCGTCVAHAVGAAIEAATAAALQVRRQLCLV
jgi:hypothetical protein